MVKFRDYRELKVVYQEGPKYQRLLSILARYDIKYELGDRKMKIKKTRVASGSTAKDQNNVVMILYGYDGLEKYRTSRVSIAEMYRIFEIIDQMPMRRRELQNRQ